ncbi:DUF6301 family protein [Arachnia propionica]|uniref:DUF6301 family protein n=1 Tax=Arachnia propionica TaxID=1750 RepID=UPI0030CF55F2
MIIFPPQEFITWANTLVQFPWPIQVDDFAPYAEKLGWKPTSLPDEFSVRAGNNGGRAILGDDEAGDVYELFLRMASNEAEDAEGAVGLNDHFVSCVAAGREAWGDPFLLEAGDGPGVTWRFPGDMFTQVTRGSRAVLFNFFTPQGKYQFV